MRKAVNAHNLPSNGVLLNHGKCFLELASSAVRDINGMHDESNLTFSRKAMILRGFFRQTNGLSEVRQFFAYLQNTVSLYRENFEGLNPDSSYKEK